MVKLPWAVQNLTPLDDRGPQAPSPALDYPDDRVLFDP